MLFNGENMGKAELTLSSSLAFHLFLSLRLLVVFCV